MSSVTTKFALGGPARTHNDSPRIVLVTGPSGAGRSTAIHALEDFGYEAIDNLPLSLLPKLFETGAPKHPLALGLDARNRDFSPAALLDLTENLCASTGIPAEILYLDCRTDVLLRRYSETRRRHPLAPEGSPHQGILRELDLLAPVGSRADYLIDTSDLTPHDLRAAVARWFAPDGQQNLATTIHSFSYKRGIPQGVDMVFDCRFLRNPHWEPALRKKTGRSDEVAQYIAQDPRFPDFFDKVTELSQMLLPAYIEEGKAHLSIGLGCTGGQHRSVMVAERLAEVLMPVAGNVAVRHRELSRHLNESTVSGGNGRVSMGKKT